MTGMQAKFLTIAGLTLALSLGGCAKISQVPIFKADVPESIHTPDKVHTETLGTLSFFDASPTKETVRKTYDFLDLTRGISICRTRRL